MRVTLINHTVNAEHLLVFTKGTRLGLNAERWDKEKPINREAELEYIANTIPSSWEFVDYTFLIEDVSRAFTHQFVRNRHGSYAQESLRVVNKGDFEFVWPASLLDSDSAVRGGNQLLMHIKDYCAMLLEHGHATEDVRAFLPTNIATNIVAKFNLRTFVDLAKSRMGGRTQAEYRDVLTLMAQEVLIVHPWVDKFLFADRGRDYFKDIEAFAEREYGGDLLKKGELLKIVDKMRKS